MKALAKWIAVLLWVIDSAWAANPPHIGYVYPAGGQQGTTFSVVVGGQHLQDTTQVFIGGEGVTATVTKYSVKYEPRRLRQIYRNKENALAALEGKEGKELDKLQRKIAQSEKQLAVAEIPEGMDINNKKSIQKYYKSNSSKNQFNPQLSNLLRIDVAIAKDAPPGVRELRIGTREGLSNPIYFQVGILREFSEVEPNDDHMAPELQTVRVPSILNGQILPGDIDHFRFKALKGQSIVVNVSARKITPYLADAVPGWFQAVVALYDEEGNEVAYQDDYKFNPDPVLFFDVSKPGIYTLSIKDSIYRGREDFVYRIAIGELPFITSIFPLGAEQGTNVKIALAGKNLPKSHLSGNLSENEGKIRHISVKKKGYRSNAMPFAIGDLTETFEIEPNNSPAEAQPVEQPLVVNGRIQEVGDIDLFSFHGEKGDSLSIKVMARRLNSPLDSVIQLTGPGIERPVRNDDDMERDSTHLHLGAGLVTHYADSSLRHTLSATGTYYVQIGDAQAKGGLDHTYRLRISPFHPAFQLRMEPSGLHIAPGATVVFTVHALRSGGCNKAIKLEAKNLPPGFEMSTAMIPADADTTRFTLTAPKKIAKKMICPEIIGTAIIDGEPIVRSAAPVDDQMQAFLYRHLVPAQELVLVPGDTPSPLVFEILLPPSGIIELPLGEEVRLSVKGRFQKGIKGAKLMLDHPPEGLTVVKSWIGQKKKEKGGKLKGQAVGSIVLKAEAPLKPGDTASLVVSAIVRKGKEETRYPAPAIPVKILPPHAPPSGMLERRLKEKKTGLSAATAGAGGVARFTGF